MKNTKKIYLIAGERSGDFIASRLIKSLKLKYRKTFNDDPEIEFLGVGGELMKEEGLADSLFSIDDISIIGFLEVIPLIFKLRRLINLTVADIVKQEPDLLITIDSPGFTYRVAKKIRLLLPGLKMIHVVAPSVWAYKPSRAQKYADIYDSMFVLFPFEVPYFTKLGLDCRYIGHPILEQQVCDYDVTALKEEYNICSESKVICVTPGSRRAEIMKHLPIFAQAIELVKREYPNLNVLIVLHDSKQHDLAREILKDSTFNFRFVCEKFKAFAVSDLAVAKIGTNIFEIAMSQTPMIVCYKLNILTYLILRCCVRVRYASLINIIADSIILPEFIQSRCTPELIAAEIRSLFSEKEKMLQQTEGATNILEQMGFNSDITPSEIAADIIIKEFL